MTCPITKETPLTENQIKNFCKLGCCPICEELLEEYIKKIKVREEKSNEGN